MFSLHRDNQKLLRQIIFIDGFSSSGKSLLCQLLSSLERFENWQIDYSFENIAVAHYLNKISNDAVDSILNTKSDELIYNLFIGRNVNFRASDQSSPFFIGNQNKYLNRIKDIDGSIILDRIKDNNPILPIHIHYIYGHTDILLNSLFNKMGLYIIMLRDPFYLIKSWFESNWPEIIGNSKRDFHLNIKKNDLSAPWFTFDYFDQYINSNNFEKSILTVYHYYKKLFHMYEITEKKYRDKTMLIFFDDFISDPIKYIDKLCNIFNIKKNNNFFDLMKKFSLPREVDTSITKREVFYQEFKNEINPEFIKLTDDLYQSYNYFYNKNKII